MDTRYGHNCRRAAQGLLLAGLVGVFACDTEKLHGEPVSEEEAEVRDEAALHPVERRDDHAETAEELKRRQRLEGEGKKPESPAEMREEMKLEPE